jgi:hypothetical protein
LKPTPPRDIGIRSSSPHPSLRRTPRRASDGERFFTDFAGRLWSVARPADTDDAAAVVFCCISDSREPTRAIATPESRLSDIPDDRLRGLLDAAPRLGRLV